eukprot:569269-Prymnesium_polylepis.2
MAGLATHLLQRDLPRPRRVHAVDCRAAQVRGDGKGAEEGGGTHGRLEQVDGGEGELTQSEARTNAGQK